MSASDARAYGSMASQQSQDQPVPPEPDTDINESTEDTPLLSRQDEPGDGGESVERGQDARSVRSSAASSLLRSIQSQGKGRAGILGRWPSFLALALLCVFAIVILIGGFFAPATVQEYASQATKFEPTRLSLSSLSPTGAIVRVEGDFSVRADRVSRSNTRNFGKFATWIAAEAETGDAEIKVTVPEQGNLLLGSAKVPPLKVNIRDGHTTRVDFEASLEPGPAEGFRHLVSDFVDGRLGQLKINGVAEVPLKSGILSLGKQIVSQSISYGTGHGQPGSPGKPGLPPLPAYKIDGVNFRQIDLPNGFKGLTAQASISVNNTFPISFWVPPMGFAILVDACDQPVSKIMVADATTDSIKVEENDTVNFNVTGFVRQLPEAFLKPCPGSNDSPLDSLVSNYIHGEAAKVYVQGSDSPSMKTPEWLTDLIYGVTVPVPVPGHSFGHLIKKFSMSDVHFSLPDFFAEPDTPDAQPKISATVNALIALPDEVDFPIQVHRIKSFANVFYRNKKLGNLNLRKWHKASSKKVDVPKEKHPDLEVTSSIRKAPLNITDQAVFQDVVQGLLRGKDNINLTVKAEVDVELETALGTFDVRKIPAKGVVPVKAFGRGNLTQLAPSVGDLRIVSTTDHSLSLKASANFTNPTKYAASIPYADVNILVNKTIVGHATIKDAEVEPGKNLNIPIEAVWDPSTGGGSNGTAIGRELLSQYISGYNTSLTLRTHRDTIPSQPELGRALEAFEVDFPTPKVGSPDGHDGHGHGDGDKEAPHFISGATMHLISSTATFTLHSPLKRSTLDLTYINATAYYKSQAVGRIMYDGEINVPPGSSETPRLPVDWSLDSIGYDAVRRALGGTLKLSAEADVGVRIGDYVDKLWFTGRGIGASVRP